MTEKYLLIIWNKTLWCEKRIVKDLSQSFTIVFDKYIVWDKNSFGSNLKSFYGSKIDNVKAKINITGYGKFRLIIFEDNSPNYENRIIHDKNEIVNSNVYDKKILYRKWTGYNFRIHCSISEKETNHDLAVLFGSDDINSFLNNKGLVHLNTKGIRGFNSLEDFNACMSLFGDNTLYLDSKDIYIFSKCKLDTLRFISPLMEHDNMFYLTFNEVKYKLIIFGEMEGDLPNGFIERAESNKIIIEEILAISNQYLHYINSNREYIPEDILSFLTKYDFDSKFSKRESLRNNGKDSFIKRIKLLIRYFAARLANIFIVD